MEETDHNTGIMTLLFAASVCVLLSPSTERSRAWTYGLTSLSEKTSADSIFSMISFQRAMSVAVCLLLQQDEHAELPLGAEMVCLDEPAAIASAPEFNWTLMAAHFFPSRASQTDS